MTSWLDEVRWNEQGLVPCVAEDTRSGRALMLAWMNREALELTAREGRAVYWSRSRRRLWRKGEQSGHEQRVREIRLDCDADAVVLVVEQVGGIAHAIPGANGASTGDSKTPDGSMSIRCRRRRIGSMAGAERWTTCWRELAEVIEARKNASVAESYVASLYAGGIDAILKKVGEEAIEVVIAGKDGDRDALVHEVADLWFHCLGTAGGARFASEGDHRRAGAAVRDLRSRGKGRARVIATRGQAARCAIVALPRGAAGISPRSGLRLVRPTRAWRDG